MVTFAGRESMNSKHRRFAEEYSVDHNASAAAIRAGYEAGRAKQTGYRMMQKVEVQQLVARLDGEKSDALGLEAEQALRDVKDLLEVARQTQPKTWKGEPVTFVDEDGETQVVTEFRSPALAARMAELLWKKAGFDVSRTAVAADVQIVHTLRLDRDLSEEHE